VSAFILYGNARSNKNRSLDIKVEKTSHQEVLDKFNKEHGTNSIVSVGSNHSTYPARVMTSCNAQITNYSTQVYISYVYDYYLSAYITDGVYRTAYITFSVSGGDIYG
jgi:hypothetical protein